jgi:protoheme IX farnesyltransferase
MINYYLITKPGIILGNLITVAAGFLLGSRGHFDVALFLETLLGITLIIASACVFNNLIDRKLDKQMNRTKNRALVIGLIKEQNAAVYGSVLGLAGLAVLLFFTNLLTAAIAAIGFFVYVCLYSLWKSRTVYGTAIGSIAGATPPVIGYCSASGQFDTAAVLLFAILVFWQMPHFFAIALMYFDDYKRAKIPVLPVSKGIMKTKIHMLLYILGFILLTTLLTLLGYTGYVFLLLSTCLGLIWLGVCIKGLTSNNDQQWGRHMFRLSLAIITALCFAIPFDTIP